MPIGTRTRRRKQLGLAGLVLAAIATLTAPTSAQAETQTLCGQYQTASVANGRYIVDNNNYGADVDQCLTTDGGANFTVVSSTASASPPQGPVSYPEIFEGCHWNTCSSNTNLPLRVDNIGSATSSWSTKQTPTGNYNTAYDLWFNSTPGTSGQPDGAELMVWLDRRPVSDSPPGSIASINGVQYVAWQTSMSANGKTWPLVGYRLVNPTDTVTNLDLRAFVRDAVVRGAVKPEWYLTAVEAGFEVWSGGTGLATTSFSSTSEPGYPVGQTRSGASNTCLNNHDGANTAGNPITVEACTTSTAQQWTAGIDGTISHAGMCVGTTGTQVALHPCDGGPQQVWLPAFEGGLWNLGSGLCLHDPSGIGSNGTRLDLAACDGSQSQRWALPTTVAATRV